MKVVTSGDGRSPRAADWAILVTSLARKDFKAADISALYRLRWRFVLAFKGLRHISKLRGRTNLRARKNLISRPEAERSRSASAGAIQGLTGTARAWRYEIRTIPNSTRENEIQTGRSTNRFILPVCVDQAPDLRRRRQGARRSSDWFAAQSTGHRRGGCN